MCRPNMHSDVYVLHNILWIIFMCSIVSQTQQDEIKTSWNNRLYPTNSVYEMSSSGQTTSVQSPSIKNSHVLNKAPNVNAAEEIYLNSDEIEEEYDDDYESDDISESSKDHEESINPKNYESKDGEATEEYDSEFIYDDYDNGTNSQAPKADVIDYTLTDESLSHENIRDEKTSFDIEDEIKEGPEQSQQHQQEVKADDKQQSIEIKNKMRDESDKINEQANESDEMDSDEKILIGEAVVSVVTTKSVVNGTFAVPTLLPMTTEQMMSPIIQISNTTPQSTIHYSTTFHNSNVDSTEDSIIVASVQTSRSISGAHYLPFNLNIDNDNTNTSIIDHTVNKTLPLESTESIIDKLDRVQSELSSGFLSGGFRTAGNALQLDVLSEQRPTSTRKTFTTTGKAPIISRFMPRRQNDRKPISTTTHSPPIKSSDIFEMMNDQVPSEKPKSLFKIPWPGSPRTRLSTTTISSRTTTIRTSSGTIKPFIIQDISAFVPPGFKIKKEDETTERSLFNDILARSKVNFSSLLPTNYKSNSNDNKDNNGIKNTTRPSAIPALQNLFAKSNVDLSALLPSDYNKRKNTEKLASTSNITASNKTITSTPLTPIQKTLQELFSKSSVDTAAFLPPDYQSVKNNVENIHENKPEDELSISTLATTSKTPGGIKLVFPSRPGGRKTIVKSEIQQNRGASMFITPKIQKGWPTRTTTEFTGWPMQSTTQISIEKLLEAARTATVSSLNSSIIPITTTVATTTSTSTTTSTTMRPTTPGLCVDECEVAGTIRIIGNTTWVPELLDRNTREWQQLADEIEKEMNLVFLKSAILRKWYKNVRIDAFSQGSILVDYFIELQDLTQKVNTQELKILFHDSLRAYNAHRWNETKIKGPIRLGEYVIDPKSTDFVVIPKINLPQPIEKDDRLIPQWAIAVIVIGVGGLLFIIIFGVSVLVNRQNASKLKTPISGFYGEDAAKNIIHSSHVAPSQRSSQDYPKTEISTIWNETDAWRDKSFESNSNKILVDGMLRDDKKYNAYDSWRSEWNGYYYQPSHTSSKFAGYESAAGFSRHPPDYDTNF